MQPSDTRKWNSYPKIEENVNWRVIFKAFEKSLFFDFVVAPQYAKVIFG